MAKKKKALPRLLHMATLGTLGGYSGKDGEWSVEKKLKKIRKAGFDGFVGRLTMVDAEQVAQSGLVFACTTDLGGIPEIRTKLKAIKFAGARVVNVQMLDHNTSTRRAVEVARRLMDAADDIGIDVSVEVHRDTCTETPEKTYALAAGYEKVEKKPLKMTWDFSHPAVIKHLSAPFYDRLVERPDLVQLANQFHFRPFNGHHAQIPALNRRGELTPEFLDWLEFADDLLGLWLEAAPEGRELFVCPEQIPPGYYLSVFGDRWKDVIAIRSEVEKVWRRRIRRWKVPS